MYRQTDRQAGITKLTVAFPNFANAPKSKWKDGFDGVDPSRVAVDYGPLFYFWKKETVSKNVENFLPSWETKIHEECRLE